MSRFGSPQVNVYVDDIDRSVGFYRGLGFEESFRTPRTGVPIHVELRLDGFCLGIAAAASARADHDLDVEVGGRSVEICLWADDTDAAYAELLSAGATSMSEPHDWLDGRLRVAWVTGPEGTPIELVQRLQRPDAQPAPGS